MDCLSCEIKRAKLYAFAARQFGASLTSVAESLSRKYGATYDVVHEREHMAIYRRSKLAPYIDVLIHRETKKWPNQR